MNNDRSRPPGRPSFRAPFRPSFLPPEQRAAALGNTPAIRPRPALLAAQPPRLADLVFTPGHSPFCIKGTALNDALFNMDRLPGKRRACIDRVPSPALRQFFDQIFLASGWYDLYPLLFLNDAAAAIAGVSYEQWLRDSSAEHAEIVLGGIYRFVLRVLSPSTMTTGLTRLAAMYFNFVQVSRTAVRGGRMEILLDGAPAPIAEYLRGTVPAFLEVALRLAGQPAGQLTCSPARPSGSRVGIPIFSVLLTLPLSTDAAGLSDHAQSAP